MLFFLYRFSGAIEKSLKPYYAACILAGICALHNNGLMHRYVTPEAVYVTTKGVPMVSQHDVPLCDISCIRAREA